MGGNQGKKSGAAKELVLILFCLKHAGLPRDTHDCRLSCGIKKISLVLLGQLDFAKNIKKGGGEGILKL